MPEMFNVIYFDSENTEKERTVLESTSIVDAERDIIVKLRNEGQQIADVMYGPTYSKIQTVSGDKVHIKLQV